MPGALHALPDHRAVENIESGKQSGRAVAYNRELWSRRGPVSSANPAGCGLRGRWGARSACRIMKRALSEAECSSLLLPPQWKARVLDQHRRYKARRLSSFENDGGDVGREVCEAQNLAVVGSVQFFALRQIGELGDSTAQKLFIKILSLSDRFDEARVGWVVRTDRCGRSQSGLPCRRGAALPVRQRQSWLVIDRGRAYGRTGALDARSRCRNNVGAAPVFALPDLVILRKQKCPIARRSPKKSRRSSRLYAPTRRRCEGSPASPRRHRPVRHSMRKSKS